MFIKDYLFTNIPVFIFIIVLVLFISGILIYYFQCKIKEQNHKIESMFSLVTTIAEELNHTKPIPEENTTNKTNNLICVSDDDNNSCNSDSDDSDSDDSDSDDSDSDDEVDDSDDDNDDDDGNLERDRCIDAFNNAFDNSNNIRISINDIVTKNNDDTNINIDDIVINHVNMNDIDDDVVSLSDKESINDVENIKHIILDELLPLNTISEPNVDIKDDNLELNNLKSINILNLEEDTNKNSNVDYKKMTIQRLKSIVQEKGLSLDCSKLKKNELLKLLGVD